MEHRNKQKYIGKAAGWSFAATISAKIMVPISNIILARVLAPEIFGVVATINVVISFADMLSQAGFHQYLIQHECETEKDLQNSATVAFWSNFCISMVVLLAIILFRHGIAVFIGAEGYESAICVAGVVLPLHALSNVQEALCQRKFEYKRLFFRRVAVCLVPFVFTLPIALLGGGYWSLILGTVVGEIVKVVLLTVNFEWYPKLMFDCRLFMKMASFGVWTLLEALALWATSNIDILIVSKALGEYYAGLYKNSQTTVTGLLALVTGATTPILFASLSRAQNDDEEFKRIFFMFQKYVGMFVLPLGVGIFVFRELITYILLGSRWMEASEFIGIWGLSTSIVCVWGTFSREVYRAKGRPRLSVLVQVIQLLFVIPMCLIGINYGFSLFGYFRSAAYLQIVVVHMIAMKVYVKMSPWKMLTELKEPIVCSVLMGLFGKLYVWLFPAVRGHFLGIFLCGILYFASLCIFPKYRELLREILKERKYT